ncbi:MAG: hypothetical protein AAGA77_00555 [Bacteroidota bacterium]
MDVSSSGGFTQYTLYISALKPKFDIYKGKVAHWITNENTVLCSEGNRVVRNSLNQGTLENDEVIFTSPSSLFDFNSLLKRVGRKGFHFLLKPEHRQEIIGVWNNKIFVWKDKFEVSPLNFRGSRPLNICYNPKDDCYYFGEYFSNQSREEVFVYRSSDGLEWEKTYTFSPGTIRHVHQIQYDSIRGGMWILTGDTNAESAIYFTDNGCKSMEKVFFGSQKARAVSIIAEKDMLIIPSDTPLEQNAIREFNFTTKEINDVYTLPNSAFHTGTFGGDWEFVTTVAEPSRENNESEAFIFIRKKGERWVELIRSKQDALSSVSKRFFRYPEFIPCGNLKNFKYLIFYCRGVSQLNDSTIIFDLEDIIRYYHAIK